MLFALLSVLHCLIHSLIWSQINCNFEGKKKIWTWIFRWGWAKSNSNGEEVILHRLWHRKKIQQFPFSGLHSLLTECIAWNSNFCKPISKLLIEKEALILSLLLKKRSKKILDPEPNPDRSQNLTDYASSKCQVSYKSVNKYFYQLICYSADRQINACEKIISLAVYAMLHSPLFSPL